MNPEQKAIAKRLGIVAAVLAVVVLVVYFVYSPKDTPGSGKLYGVDKRSVAAIFRAGVWAADSNGSGRWEPASDVTVSVGKAGDIPLAGTWDIADGPSIGVFKNGVFTLLIHGHPQDFNFGGATDIPVVGDWNGDGRTKIGVFRNGFWLLDLNGNGKWDGASIDREQATGGTPGEVPVVGDWNGDGKTDVGVYRPDSSFALDINGNGVWDKGDSVVFFGQPGNIAVIGDWNGDGRSKIGVFHDGAWALDYNGNLAWEGVVKDRYIALGAVGDKPVVGDWNGDGRTKVGVYRQSSWMLDSDGNGVYDQNDKNWAFGLPGDIPIPLTPLRKK